MSNMRCYAAAIAFGACLCLLQCSQARAFVVGRATDTLSQQPKNFRGSGPDVASTMSYSASFAFIGLAAVGASVSASIFRRSSRAGSKQKIVECQAFAGGLVGNDNDLFGGTYDFDPCNFSRVWPEHLPWMREAELKHGRVCMLAWVGLVVQDSGVELIVPDTNIITAHNACIDGLGGPMWYLAVFIGSVESLRFKQLGLGFEKLTLENAGDLNFGKSFLPQTEEGIRQMKIKELKNGRLAMLAFSGAITQSVAWNCPHFPWIPTN